METFCSRGITTFNSLTIIEKQENRGVCKFSLQESDITLHQDVLVQEKRTCREHSWLSAISAHVTSNQSLLSTCFSVTLVWKIVLSLQPNIHMSMEFWDVFLICDKTASCMERFLFLLQRENDNTISTLWTS